MKLQRTIKVGVLFFDQSLFCISLFQCFDLLSISMILFLKEKIQVVKMFNGTPSQTQLYTTTSSSKSYLSFLSFYLSSRPSVRPSARPPARPPVREATQTELPRKCLTR